METEKRAYRLQAVIAMYGVSKPTVYRMMKAGKFPKPVRISKRAVVWLASSLNEYDKMLLEEV